MTDLAEQQPVAISGLAGIADRYDNFFVDQYGVIHNGRPISQRVKDCLAALKRRGKTVAILSNSGRTARENIPRLGELGLPLDLIDDVITSGDVAIKTVLPKLVIEFGGKFVPVLSPGAEIPPIPGGEPVHDYSQACFVFFAGIPRSEVSWGSEFVAELQRYKLPLVCANPDLVSPFGNSLRPGPGASAALYAQQGGQVIYVGKPHPEIYSAALAHTKVVNKRRVLCIGDSLGHDIAGAANAGLDSLYVMHGIERDLFDFSDPEPFRNSHARADNGHVSPTWVTHTLSW